MQKFKPTLKPWAAVILVTFLPSAYALTILNDGNFAPYQTTGVNTSTDDIEIQTSSLTPSPQITLTSSGQALAAIAGKTLTVNSSNPFQIKLDTTSAFGIYAANGTIHTQSAIQIDMQSGRGIYLANGGTGQFDQDMTINATGANAIGAMAYSTSMNAGQGHFYSTFNFNASGSNSFGIVLQNGNPTGAPPSFTFDGLATLRMTGDNSIGILSQDIAPGGTQNASLLHFKNGLDVEVDDGVAINASLDHLTIQIDGTSRIISNNRSTNNPNAIEALAGTVNINGQTTLLGNIESIDTGTVNLMLAANSSLTGKMDNYAVTAIPPGFTQPGQIHVNFQAPGSTWNMENTGTSYINSLQGNGATLRFLANVTTQASDKLIITDTNAVSGTHYISVQNDATQPTNGTETLTLIETQGGNAQFLSTQKVELGGYLYDVRQQAGTNNWELYGAPNGSSSSAQAAANFMNVSYLMSYIDMQTLLQRMGQLRHNTNTDKDFWLRSFGGKLDGFGGGKLSDFDMDYFGIQGGIDHQFLVDSGRVYAGIMGGYSHGKPNYTFGSGKAQAYHAGIYATYINDDTNFYVDGVLRYTRMTNRFDVLDTRLSMIHGSAHTNGLSISIEGGKRFYLQDQNTRQGFYLEPQLQYVYSHQGSDTVNSTNGLRVGLDAYDSNILRASILTGYTLIENNNPLDAYLKIGVSHEFDGKTSYSLNFNNEKHDFGQSMWDIGLGINAQINQFHNLYLELNYMDGSRFNNKQFNVGYRYSF